MIDFSSNQTIFYKDIDAIEKDEKKVYIQQTSLASILEFEKEVHSKEFFKNLEKRVKH